MFRSEHLWSSGRFSGVISSVQVDRKNVGLWNFVASRGCKETHVGPEQEVDADSHNCYSFSGDGYATQRNAIKHYDPRYLSIALEFRSFDEDALLLFVVSADQVRHASC